MRATREHGSVAAAPDLMHATSADGTRIALHGGGSGPAILLVHGTAGDHRDWAQVAPLLDGFTVWAMDRRGRGGSSDGPAHSLAIEGQDVVAAAQRVNAQFIVAHSLGAVIALAAVRAGYPALLYEPPIIPDGDPADAATLQTLADAGKHEELVERFLLEFAGAPPEEVAAMKQDPTWAAAVASAPTIPREVRAFLGYRFDAAGFGKSRVRLLVGSESPPFFGEAAQAIAAATGGTVHTLPGQGHAAMMVAPQMVADRIREFAQVATLAEGRA